MPDSQPFSRPLTPSERRAMADLSQTLKAFEKSYLSTLLDSPAFAEQQRWAEGLTASLWSSTAAGMTANLTGMFSGDQSSALGPLIAARSGAMEAIFAGLPSMKDSLTRAAPILPSGWGASFVERLELPQIVFGEDFWRNLRGVLNYVSEPFVPDNLHGRPLPDVDDLETLASEGISLWAVPRAELIEELLAADTPEQRSDLLSLHAVEILEDCRKVAERCLGSSNDEVTRGLIEAIETLGEGKVTTAISALAAVLETTINHAAGRQVRHELTAKLKGDPVDHFNEVSLGTAMVFAPLATAYRPMQTPEEQLVSATFARNLVVHMSVGPHMNLSNGVQAAMLATATLDFLTFWSGEEALQRELEERQAQRKAAKEAERQAAKEAARQAAAAVRGRGPRRIRPSAADTST